MLLVVIPVSIILFLIIPTRSLNLFFIPMLTIAFFLSYYLYKQGAKEDEERLKKRLKTVQEDMDAEKWIKESFAPDTLLYIKANRWIVVLYSFFFILIVTFLWSYLTNGFLIALRNFAYAGVLFWTFVMYVLIFPIIIESFQHHLPKKLLLFSKNDWARGYIFLFPISFILYVLFPYEALQTEFLHKLVSLPVFFLMYTALFLCTYSIVYIFHDLQEENEHKIQEEVKKAIHEK